MTYPDYIKIVEVGPRDGLQNEATPVPANVMIDFIDLLSGCGFQVIESGAFVSPKWVPQMANTGTVLKGITRKPGTSYPVLVPNLKGYERAIDSGVEEIAVFAAASETFSMKNINCSIKDSLQRFAPILQQAMTDDIRVRGYISCVLGCPYEGAIQADMVREIADSLLQAGCYEISLGDTVGTGTPLATQQLIEAVVKSVPVSQLAMHFHDTYGQALSNILIGLQHGISVIDSSVAGLGGCPYAKGASGNVATEDVLYMLDGMGIETGIDAIRLRQAADFIGQFLGRENTSKAAMAKK